MRLQLPTVTLMCIDCVDTDRAIKVLEHCKSKVDFGVVKLLTSLESNYEHRVEIMPLHSLIMYSVFMLTKVHEYIDTSHVLIVQRDGWILNADSWEPAWLELDYIGPLFMQYDKVGSGGFSLRKKEAMYEIADRVFTWDGTETKANMIQSMLGYYEDGVISFSKYGSTFKIGSLDQAANFAHGGNRNPQYFREKPFGWHRTFADIDFKTGLVNYDLSKDIKVTYDQIIDAL